MHSINIHCNIWTAVLYEHLDTMIPKIQISSYIIELVSIKYSELHSLIFF